LTFFLNPSKSSQLLLASLRGRKKIPAHDILAVQIMRLYAYRSIFVSLNKDRKVRDRRKVELEKRRALAAAL
jgi:hypothetical protein